MKLLLLMLFGIALVGAKPRKPERAEDSECTDIASEEDCDLIAVKRDCVIEEEAQKCRKTCKVCQVCEDKKEKYCETEMAEDLLDCNRGDHQDLCEKTCGMCIAEGSASRKVKRAATEELRTHQTGCQDKDFTYCRNKMDYGHLDCSRAELAEYCPKTCGVCNERAVLHKGNKAGTRKLKSKRALDEDDCTDDEDAAFCSDILAKNICSDPEHKAEAGKCAKTCGLCFECKDYSTLCATDGIDVCGQEYIEHYCLKSCNKCNQHSLSHASKNWAKRDVSDPEARDPLAHLLRK